MKDSVLSNILKLIPLLLVMLPVLISNSLATNLGVNLLLQLLFFLGLAFIYISSLVPQVEIRKSDLRIFGVGFSLLLIIFMVDNIDGGWATLGKWMLKGFHSFNRNTAKGSRRNMRYWPHAESA